MKFKVSYQGFKYVEAVNEDEARDMFDNDEEVYGEQNIIEVKEVDEFTVSFW